MNVENPYRAAGAFAGKAYIRRGADAELIDQIRDNQYYPYFAAPRQSGKSSLIARTMASLDPAGYRCALVDLSPFVVRSYDDFWRQFLHEVARSVLEKHGLAKWFIHGTCHAVGLEVHDAWRRDAVLRAGCVITVEPGVYDAARNLGVRIEDTVLVTGTGCEVLSSALPKSRAEIEALMREDPPPGLPR